MAETYSTPAAQALQSHFGRLVDIIPASDVPTFGAKLFAKEIVTRAAMEIAESPSIERSVRVSRMLLAVVSHLSLCPEHLQTVLEIFREEPIYRRIADDIETTYREICGEGHSAPKRLTLEMSKYATFLRDSYKRFKLPVKNKWLVSPCQKIIKLAAVETKGDQTASDNFDPRKLARASSVDEYIRTNSVTLFSLDNLLEARDGCTPRSVIVQGAPGIGKSTFAWKFCRKWAKGKLHQEYDLVVLLKMRDKRVREAKTLSDLFYHLDSKLSQSIADEVISRSGKEILFLFEGLDELPSNLLSEDSFLLEILQGIALPQLTVMVTSRPWAVQQLVEKCNNQISRQVSILGFTREDIDHYIDHSFKCADRDDFMQYLHTHPQLESIMYVPLNAAFVVKIYKGFKLSSEAIPHTLTQVYTALIKRLIKHHVKSMPEFSNISSVDLQKLPEPINSIFQQICELAFMSFTKNPFQVSFSDLETAQVDSLGLMQSIPDLSDSESSLHSFLHFTIQEYLAAYHLSLLSPERQRMFFEVHASDPKFSVFLGFLIGLKNDLVRHLHDVVQNFQQSSSMKLEAHYLHWLYESQSPQDVAKFLGSGLVFFQSYYKLTPFDIYSLSYCMSYSNCTWNLIIDLEDLTTIFISSENCDQLYSGHMEELSVFNATEIGLQKFFSLPRRLFADVSFLYFYNRESSSVGSGFYNNVASLLRNGVFKNLVEFQLLDAVKDSGIGTVIDALHTSCSKLDTLKVEKCIFATSNGQPTDIVPLCQYITSSKVISRLGLPGNVFRGESLHCLFSALPYTHSLTRLDLSYNKLGPADIEMLSIALETSTIKALRLRSCSIDAESVEYLADGLERNTTLQWLFLNRNSLSITGAAVLAAMLGVNTTLRELHVHEDDSIGIEGAIKLINALEHNQTLESLYLSKSCQPVEYMSVLMEKVRKSGRVKFL